MDSHGYSAAVLAKIVLAGGHLKSFALAAEMLAKLAELSISAQHVRRLTEQVGEELRQEQAERTEQWVHYRLAPVAEAPPEIAVVEVDGGRLMTRAPEEGRGVHQPQWKEDKIACLLAREGPDPAQDPAPEPPQRFCDPEQVDILARQIKSQAGREAEARAPEPPTEEVGPAAEEPKSDWPPRRGQRTCVATLQESRAFGHLVAAEAHRRQFFAAARRAFLGDGQRANWTIWQKCFGDFVPILDFIHVLAYLYLAAGAVARSGPERWRFYLAWMKACWQGQVIQVIAALDQWQAQLGAVGPEDTLPPEDPRQILASVRGYLEHNASRMDYSRYRTLGLPVTSSAVESLIKEFNYRVKGTEKFWNRPDGAERILQVRAALLSEDDRLADYFARRPGSLYRRPCPGESKAQLALAA